MGLRKDNPFIRFAKSAAMFSCGCTKQIDVAGPMFRSKPFLSN